MKRIPTKIPGIWAYEPLPKSIDPDSLSNAELAEWGLPPKPDPEKHQEAYRLWRTKASYESVVPDLIETPFRHQPVKLVGRATPSPRGTQLQSSQNWSGVVVTDTANPFKVRGDGPFGRFNVPNLASNQPNSHCSIWVGIDGSGSSDVLQCGIHMAVGNYGDVDIYPWLEWFPANEVRMNNPPVGYGDDICLEVFFNSTTHGSIRIANVTSQTTVVLGIDARPGVTLTSNCVEWIVERPEINGVLSSLAPYQSFVMRACFAGGDHEGAPNFGYYTPTVGGPTSMIQDITMVDGTTAISSPVLVVGKPPGEPYDGMSDITFGRP